MSYSQKICPNGANLSDAENHERVMIHVTQFTEGEIRLLKVIDRVVMIDEGKRYITFNRKRYQIKKLRKHRGFYELRLLPTQ